MRLWAKLLKISLLIVIGLAFLSKASQAWASCADDEHCFQLVTGDDYYPFTDSKLKGGGSISRIVTEAFNTQDIKVQISWRPWVRGWEEARNNAFDGAFPWGDFYNRRDYMIPSAPLVMIEKRFYHLEDTRKIYAHSDLAGSTICSPIGYELTEINEEAQKLGAYKIVQPQEMRDCFQLLFNHRVDYVLANQWQGQATLEQITKTDQVAIFGSPFINNAFSLHLMIPKTNSQAMKIIAHFNQGLADLQASGRYQEILEDFPTPLATPKVTTADPIYTEHTVDRRAQIMKALPPFRAGIIPTAIGN